MRQADPPRGGSSAGSIASTSGSAQRRACSSASTGASPAAWFEATAATLCSPVTAASMKA